MIFENVRDAAVQREAGARLPNVWRQGRAQRSGASPLHAGVRRGPGCGAWAARGERGSERLAHRASSPELPIHLVSEPEALSNAYLQCSKVAGCDLAADETAPDLCRGGVDRELNDVAACFASGHAPRDHDEPIVGERWIDADLEVEAREPSCFWAERGRCEFARFRFCDFTTRLGWIGGAGPDKRESEQGGEDAIHLDERGDVISRA